MAADIRCCYGSGSWLLPGTGVFWLGEGAKSWVVIFSQGWWVSPRFSNSWVDRRSVRLLNLRMNSGSSLHASARVNQNCLSSFSHSKLQFFCFCSWLRPAPICALAVPKERRESWSYTVMRLQGNHTPHSKHAELSQAITWFSLLLHALCPACRGNLALEFEWTSAFGFHPLWGGF